MEIQIEPEHINRIVADAIIKSAIGDELKKAVENQLKSLSSAYDNPIEKVVKKIIIEQLEYLVAIEYGEKIREMVREKITDELVNNIISKMWDAFAEKMRY